MKPLTLILSGIINAEQTRPVIDPVWAANEAYKSIDPENRAPLLVRTAAVLHLRQLARPLLRKQFDPNKSVKEQPPSLFPDLQWRYPKAGVKYGYVLLTAMTMEDIRYNVARMRKTSKTQASNADALEAFGEMYIRDTDAEEA